MQEFDTVRLMCFCHAVAGGTAALRGEWEAGAFQLERLQAAPECVQAEEALQAQRQAPTWSLPFTPTPTPDEKLKVTPCRLTCMLISNPCVLCCGTEWPSSLAWLC